ncbi:acyltransferase family protein [Rhodobacteraceae bacterium DSL-40]|uniref:acyltransferase family protein n=1 Tax=Amaricoccus sp. B4 TaxID=3368557 RepID=UPI0013A6DB72
MAHVSVAASKRESTDRNSAERIVWLDQARGIGIVLVVFGHALRGLISAEMLPGAAWSAVDFVLYTFHMPLFMYLSGINVPRALGRPGFLSNKFRTIVYPYFLWSVLFGSALALLSNLTNGSVGWSRLLAIPYDPIPPFWFLYVLFIFMITCYVRNPDYIMLSLSIIFLLISPFATYPLLHQVLYFFFFFVLGALVRPTVSARALLLGGLGIFFISNVLVIVSGSWQQMSYYAPILLPAALGGGAMIVGLSMLLPKQHLLVELGRSSMAIYVLHIFFTAGVRIAFQKIDLLGSVTILAIATIAGVFGPYMIFIVMKRLRIAHLFGLK